MSTIDSEHLEVSDGGQEGPEEAGLADDYKLSICAQARVSGVSVAQRYAMNTNLIHKWLRDPRSVSED